jgi:hypothetical protein
MMNPLRNIFADPIFGKGSPEPIRDIYDSPEGSDAFKISSRWIDPDYWYRHREVRDGEERQLAHIWFRSSCLHKQIPSTENINRNYVPHHLARVVQNSIVTVLANWEKTADVESESARYRFSLEDKWNPDGPILEFRATDTKSDETETLFTLTLKDEKLVPHTKEIRDEILARLRKDYSQTLAPDKKSILPALRWTIG